MVMTCNVSAISKRIVSTKNANESGSTSNFCSFLTRNFNFVTHTKVWVVVLLPISFFLILLKFESIVKREWFLPSLNEKFYISINLFIFLGNGCLFWYFPLIFHFFSNLSIFLYVQSLLIYLYWIYAIIYNLF